MEFSKYKRTAHLDWSEGVQSDDKIILPEHLSLFEGKEVVASEKMDGENSTLYTNYTHARSLDSKHNFTRDWLKKMHSVIRHDLFEGWRYVGENMWGEHSIRYDDGVLEGYFYLFAIFDDNNTLISYDDTVEIANMLDLPMPKVFYRGVFDTRAIMDMTKNLDLTKTEGYVLRLADAVEQDQNSDFLRGVAKFVRKGHVQENAEHWLKNVQRNGNLSERVKPFFMS